MSVALIAGEGALPEEIARRMAGGGEKLVVYAMRENCESIAHHASCVCPLGLSQIAGVLADMTSRGIRKVVLAGVVPKRAIFQPSSLDGLGRKVLERLASRDDHSLLGGVVALLEGAGFEVIGYRDILSDLMAASGDIAGREPSELELLDVAYGKEIISTIAPLSFGQSVVVCQRSVVAVEAMEGTDEMIRRAGALASGGVVVKRIKAGQDERFDIPTVGPTTLRGMASAGLTCLALHAGWTLILKPEEFRSVADENGLSVIGVDY